LDEVYDGALGKGRWEGGRDGKSRIMRRGEKGKCVKEGLGEER
jgi:hypothetical protein